MPARQIPVGGTRGTAYRAVAEERWRDGGVLLSQTRYNGAVYLAGYAIECYLKYAWCKRRGEVYLEPKLEIHSWDKLRQAAGVESIFTDTMNALYDSVVDQWSEHLRYSTRNITEKAAKQLYKVITELYELLKESLP